MSIDLSRVTGISDSRGVITEIKDSLGRVIWKSAPPFITLFDFGVVTINADNWMNSGRYSIKNCTININPNECNAIMVDGVLIEMICVYTENTYSKYYTLSPTGSGSAGTANANNPKVVSFW